MKEAQEYAKKVFNEVAHKYDEIPFFKISALNVLEIIKKHKKEANLEVLDVACGTGNVILECATCLKESSFDGVDISNGMLEKAKVNAQKLNLTNVTFHLQDITQLILEKKYDVITCSYVLFFLPNAHNVLKLLTKLLKKEGIVIFTSFTAEAFSPSNEILIPLLQKYGSPTAKEYVMDKWENLKHPKDIKHLCTLANVSTPTIEMKPIRYGMSIDAWWELFNNTGYKGMLMELSPSNYEEVKRLYYEAMAKDCDESGEVELIADSYFVVV